MFGGGAPASATPSVEPAKEKRTQPPPSIGVKIEARCHGDPSLGEEAPAEILAVSRQV